MLNSILRACFGTGRGGVIVFIVLLSAFVLDEEAPWLGPSLLGAALLGLAIWGLIKYREERWMKSQAEREAKEDEAWSDRLKGRKW